jgi:hypothetical protein
MMNRRSESFHSKTSDGTSRVTDVNVAIQELENVHMQDIVKLAHDMSIQHAKAMELQRKELEAKDARIENVVATLGKVLKEREYLKNELQRAGHQNVVMKMKQLALSERDMLKSIKDQITGKPSAAVQDRSVQTMDVQFADDKDSDGDDGSPALALHLGGKPLQVTSAATRLAVEGGAFREEIASAFKNIYESDASKGKKKAKAGQDWSFIELDSFKKEAVKLGTTFDAIVGDIKLPREWQRSLKVPAKAVTMHENLKFYID